MTDRGLLLLGVPRTGPIRDLGNGVRFMVGAGVGSKRVDLYVYLCCVGMLGELQVLSTYFCAVCCVCSERWDGHFCALCKYYHEL